MASITPDTAGNPAELHGEAIHHGGTLGDAATLLGYLLDTMIIHPEEWSLLTGEIHDRLHAIADKDTLLNQLLNLKLINGYQASRIHAGTFRGLVLGNYRVLGCIGSGGIGIIFEAEHLLMRRRVAIKVLPVDSGAQPDLITRFLREIRFVAQLSHPNIVAAFDAGISPSNDPFEEDLYYFVMERLIGLDLSQLAGAKPMAIDKACAFIYQIASALDEAHRLQLVHRDIKPSNLFMTHDGQAKLLDFGLVRHLPGNAITNPDLVIGTLEYMAPEQALDPTCVDIRTDVYSLGATFYFTLTGASPFPIEGTLLEILDRRQKQAAPSARTLRPEIPPGLDDVVQRMMALAPVDRYATPQAVMLALLPFLEGKSRSHSATSGRSRTGESGDASLKSYDVGTLMSAALPKEVGGPSAAHPARILIVEADLARRRQLVRPLQSKGIECMEADDAETAMRLVRAEPLEAVLIAVDLPETSGRELLKELRDNPPCQNLKIIMTTPQRSADEMSAFLHAGADDCFCLPISNIQLVARVRAGIKHKQVQDRTDQLSRQLLDLNVELERSANAQASDFVQARNALVLALARLVEYRSTETIAHLSRIQRYSATLAQEAVTHLEGSGGIDQEFIQTIECCAPLHDIGNVGLPDRVLLKMGRLTDEERQIMQTHAVIGAQTLQDVARRFGPDLGFLGMAIDIARHHHEHYDGNGYPDGLAGTDIPLAARIVAIADAYDALRSRRSQRPGLPHASALNLLCESSPGKFDPVLIDAFKQCAGQFDQIFREMPDSIVVD